MVLSQIKRFEVTFGGRITVVHTPNMLFPQDVWLPLAHPFWWGASPHVSCVFRYPYHIKEHQDMPHGSSGSLTALCRGFVRDPVYHMSLMPSVQELS